MNLTAWTRLAACLTIETTALLAVAALLEYCLRSPRAARTIWQAALATVALVWIVQLSGLPGVIPASSLKKTRFLISARILPLPVQEAQTDDKAAPTEVAPSPPVSDIIKWPAWLWLAGSTLLLFRFCLARVWLAVRGFAALPADEESRRLIARWQTALGLAHVRAQAWPRLPGPIAFGILRQAIALPPDFVVRFSGAEQEVVLAHEMAHLAARDPFWLMVSDAATALAWWHPLVWWARHRLQAASESAADEASTLVPGGAHALAECLVRLGHELTAPHPARALSVSGDGPRSQLAHRINRLLREPRAWRPVSAWSRWIPRLTAIFISSASAILPIQTGLSGSILAVLAATEPAHAEAPPAAVTNNVQTNAVAPPTFSESATVTVPLNYQWYVNGTQISATNAPSPITALSAATNTEIKVDVTHIVRIATAATTKISAKPVSLSRPLVVLSGHFLVVTGHGADDIGLDWIFGKAPADNVPLQVTHDFTALDTSHIRSFSNVPTNVTIDRLHSAGQSAILTPAQFAALRKRILDKNADFLGSPRIETRSGSQAHLSEYDAGTYVTGVQALNGSLSNSASIGYRADNIDLGLSLDILPTQEEDGKWRLVVFASQTSFIGYDRYMKDISSVSSPGGKPIHYYIPHPHFRAVEADSDDTLAWGQTLAVRGPLWTEVTKTKGHFLFPGKTKTVRKRLYVFVTPTKP